MSSSPRLRKAAIYSLVLLLSGCSANGKLQFNADLSSYLNSTNSSGGSSPSPTPTTLAVTSISPSGGPLAGGTAVTISGTLFSSGATVTIGSNACSSPVVSSTTQITCTTAATASGSYSVKVTNPDGSSASLANAYSFNSGPSLTSISPVSGSTVGGTSVTLTGTNFVNGASFAIKVGGTSCATSTWVSSTSATCVTPAGTTGVKSVQIINGDGQSSTLVSAFTYIAPPALTSISPSSGPIAGGTTITLTGTNFTSGGSFAIKVGGVACSTSTWVSSTSATCVTPAGTAGAQSVQIFNNDGQSSSLGGVFTYLLPAPTLSSVSPGSGSTNGGTTLTLTGANFASGASFGITVGGTACSSVSLSSSTSAICVTPAGSSGAKSVVLTNGDGQTATLSNAFTYIAPPTLTSISPSSGSTVGGTTITLTGTGFTSGGSFGIKVGGVSCSTSTWVSSTSATCVTPAGTAGSQSVQMINNDGQSATLANIFTYVTPPTLSSVSPNSGSTAGGTMITLTGANFTSGGSFAIKVGGIPCTTSSWVSSTSATCVTPAASAGTVSVQIFNNDGQSASLPSAFTYSPPPSLSGISPVQGSTTGGTTVTLSGSNFMSGGSFGIKIGNSFCTTSTWVSSTSASCVTPAQPQGVYNVTIINGDGQSATLLNQYTYIPTATKLAARGFTTCALMSDHTVECWGENTYGELGIGTTAPSNAPVAVSGLAGVTDISVGWYHSCAVVSGGSIKCWGRNDKGQLGNNSTTDSLTPVSVSGMSNAVRVSAGLAHTCALLSASPWVQCWGDNTYSQLGNTGVSSGSLVPVNVSLGSMPVAAQPVDIGAGWNHACVIDGSGSRNVWCWGRGNDGQLGNSASTTSSTAVKAGTLSANSLSINFNFSCAVATAGTVYCWGDGQWTTFGSSSGWSFTSPTQSANTSVVVSSATSLANAYSAGCAVVSGGSVVCWGTNARSVFGNGSDTVSWAASSFNHPTLTSGISQVVAGTLHMCALTSIGTVKCWGHNTLGSVGVASGAGYSPVSVAGISTAVQVKASAQGEWHCARLSNGDVNCWGSNQSGLNGSGTQMNDNPTPVLVPRTSMGSAVDIGVGPEQACAINSGGSVWCWGRDNNFMLGISNTNNPLGPTQITGITGAVKIHVGSHFACVTLNASPWVECWGDNTYGQLGNGTYTANHTPQAVSGFTSTPSLLGGTHLSACATITTSPYLKCWGYNGDGRLGNASTANSNTPVYATAAGLATAPNDLSNNGVSTMCAVTSTGNMVCWGANQNGAQNWVTWPGGAGLSWLNNNYGQNWVSGLFFGILGTGNSVQTDTGASSSLTTVGGVSGANNVGGGGTTMCAISNPGASGTVSCWGTNSFGQAGPVPGASIMSPTAISGSGYLSVTGSDNTLCALMSNGSVKCWGDGSGGQLGDGTFRHVNTPAQVSIF